jgi:hypothetical protein
MTYNFEGLLYTPSTDLNFISGIERLDNCDLTAMLERLNILAEQGESHKGRIKAVEKEIASRGNAAESKRGRKAKAGENSREIVAMDKFQTDIETAERLYGDGMPYEIDRIENEIRFYMAQNAQAFFESGKRFLRIKAHEQHGKFMASLERIGVSQTIANYAMAVVMKFGPNSPPAGNLGVEKLKMLTVFEEDKIEEYVNGGPLGSIPHDDVEKMSKRELQVAIREERKKREEDRKTGDKAIFMKEKKISELEAQLRYQEPPTQEQLAAVSLEPLKKKLFEQVLLVQFHLDEAVKVVVQAQKVDGATFPQLQEWAGTHYEQLAPIGKLFDELDQALNNCGPYNPESTGM